MKRGEHAGVKSDENELEKTKQGDSIIKDQVVDILPKTDTIPFNSQTDFNCKISSNHKYNEQVSNSTEQSSSNVSNKQLRNSL